MVAVDMQTKPCPFCAETIQAAAVKCRFCGEFLNSEKAKALQAEAEPDSESPEEEGADDGILFADRPSLFAMVPAGLKASVVLVLAWLVVKMPIEASISHLLGLKLTANQAFGIGRWRALAGFGLGVLVMLILLLKALKLSMTWYEVTADRIEWSRGILDRKVDNLDMFRVIDLKMRRSLLDCLFGIGTIVLTTTDKSDPQFVFEKVRYCRDLYDVIKKASLEAGRQSSVVHLE